MKKTRLLALLLALVMVVTLFAACGNTEPEDETTAEETTAEETTAEETTAEETTAEETEPVVEDIDFGGRTVVLNSAFISDFTPVPGESAFQDAWQEVYNGIEADLNITFDFVGGAHAYEDAVPAIMGGDIDSLGDLTNGKPLYWIPAAIEGQIAQLNTDEVKALGLDVTDENAFFQPYTTAMNIRNGEIYAASWNGPYSVCEFGWCMFVNIDYLSQYGGVDDIFQVVRDMDWTWEKFLDLQSKCAVDTDGDGNIDIWGSGEHSYGQEIFTIPGGSIVAYDDATGKYVSNLTAVETQEALQFAQNYYNSGACETSTGYGDIHRMFAAGEVAMQWGEQWNTKHDGYFAGTDVNYGIIPIPKHESAETYVNVLGGVKAWFLYTGNTHFEENAVILQKMGEAFTDTDAVWQSFLEENAAGNEQSLEMVQDYIWGQYSVTVTDYVWANNDELLNKFRNDVYFPIVADRKTVAEVVTAQDSIMQSAIDGVFHQ